MKFKALLFNIVFIIFLSACSESKVPIDGKHYQQLPEILSGKDITPVTEVFSLTCGHCRKMEDVIPTLQKAVGQNIGKMHITFNQTAYHAAVFYYAAQMQVNAIPDHQFMIDLFEAIQAPKESSAEQRKSALNRAFESRGLKSPLNYNEQEMAALIARVDEIAILSDQSKLTSVPAFIVNGKYQVISASHDKISDVATTINYLLKK